MVFLSVSSFLEFGLSLIIRFLIPFHHNFNSIRLCCYNHLSFMTSHFQDNGFLNIQIIHLVAKVLSSAVLPLFLRLKLHWYNSWICHPLSPDIFGFSYYVKFVASYWHFQCKESRTSMGKIYNPSIYTPTPHQVDKFIHILVIWPNIETHFYRSVRPSSWCHLVGSLFTSYMENASCFLRTHHYWLCPCLVGLPAFQFH